MERTSSDGCRVASGPAELSDEEALLDALTQAGIHPAYREAVRRCVDEPDAQWRYCCGSSCDPCVEQIGRAVDAFRSHLAATGRAS